MTKSPRKVVGIYPERRAADWLRSDIKCWTRDKRLVHFGYVLCDCGALVPEGHEHDIADGQIYLLFLSQSLLASDDFDRLLPSIISRKDVILVRWSRFDASATSPLWDRQCLSLFHDGGDKELSLCTDAEQSQAFSDVYGRIEALLTKNVEDDDVAARPLAPASEASRPVLREAESATAGEPEQPEPAVDERPRIVSRSPRFPPPRKPMPLWKAAISVIAMAASVAYSVLTHQSVHVFADFTGGKVHARGDQFLNDRLAGSFFKFDYELTNPNDASDVDFKIYLLYRHSGTVEELIHLNAIPTLSDKPGWYQLSFRADEEFRPTCDVVTMIFIAGRKGSLPSEDKLIVDLATGRKLAHPPAWEMSTQSLVVSCP